MNDREKIINLLSKYKNHAFGDKDEKVTVDEIIALLKAQEPKPVTNIHKEHNNVLNPNVPWVGKCPKCGKKIEGRNLTRFCKFCGQAVKWDE